jgi:hypothetical protein
MLHRAESVPGTPKLQKTGIAGKRNATRPRGRCLSPSFTIVLTCSPAERR